MPTGILEQVTTMLLTPLTRPTFFRGCTDTRKKKKEKSLYYIL